MVCVIVCVVVNLSRVYHTGNNQKKANALIESSGLKMIGIDDFDKAAKTVSQ